MNETCKKSKTCKMLLAFVLVVTMLVSTLVSGLTFSAATTLGTLSIENTVFEEDETVEVKFTVDFGDNTFVNALHMLANIDTDLTITEAKLIEDSVVYEEEFEDPGIEGLFKPALHISAENLTNGKALFESGVSADVAVQEFAFTVTFEGAEVGKEYPIDISIALTDYEEEDYTPLTGSAKIVIEAAHECVAGTPVDNGDGTHNVPCADETCDKFVEENVAHTYVDGFCACGAEEPVTGPIYDETLVIPANNGSFEASYSLLYYIPATVVDAYEELKIELSREAFVKQGDVWVRSETSAISYLTDADYRRNDDGTPKYMTNSGIKYYQYELKGIAPKEVANDIIAKVVATKDGKQYYGPTKDYNLVTYAKNQVNKGNKLANAMIAFLNFAASAQTHFKYNNASEADLANSVLTPEQKMVTLASDLVKDGTTDSTEADVKIGAFNVGFESQIELVVYLNPYAYDYTGKRLRAVYVNTSGATITDYVELGDITESLTNAGIKYLTVRYKGIAAKDMRALVTFDVVDGNDNVVSNCRKYSLTNYAANQAGKGSTLEALTKALIAFGDAMKAYKS